MYIFLCVYIPETDIKFTYDIKISWEGYVIRKKCLIRLLRGGGNEKKVEKHGLYCLFPQWAAMCLMDTWIKKQTNF